MQRSISRSAVRAGAALLTAGLVLPLGVSALADAPATAAPAVAPLAADPAHPGDDAVAYPGTAPGAATVTQSDGGDVAFTNSLLSFNLTRAFGDAWGLEGPVSHADAAPRSVTPWNLISLRLADGSEITAEDMTADDVVVLADVAADPESSRLAERHAGKSATVTFRYAEEGRSFDLTWTVVLRDGANYIQQNFEIGNVTGTFDVTSLRLVDVRAEDASVMGLDVGSPVVLGPEGGETVFLGVEHPMAEASVDGDRIQISVDRAGDLTAGDTWEYSAAVGVAPESQLRRAFLYYVERERAHARRPFLHYQSWFDLKPPGLVIQADELTEAIELLGSELTERGAQIDSFWIDDGWDYLRAPQVDESDLHVWDFDPTQFPNGFAEQQAVAEQFDDASLSVWMSPFGGYGESAARRAQLNASKPADQRLETHGSSQFRLGGERYYERFRDVTFDMMDDFGVRGFKFDGIGGGLYQRGPNENYRADYEALLNLMTDMREHQPEVFINATVGTWGSPYWLWYTDSIWRDGHDAAQVGDGDPRERYVSYRDSEVYRHTVTENPLFPVPSLMNHGFIFSDRAPQFSADHDLTDPDVREAVSADMRGYFAMGLSLQELYVRNTLVAEDQPGADWFWDELAEHAAWARENTALLTDVHWVGGDAALGQVYGTAAWSDTSGEERGMLMLRNPSASAKSIAIDVQEVLELPERAHGTYAFTEKDGLRDGFVAAAGTDYHVVLDPFEVVVFEAAPSDDEPTPSEPLPGDTSEAIDRSEWTVTASSEEVNGEPGQAENAIDGSPSTFWHTRYNPTIDPMPHELTIDMGTEHEVARFEYLPRQDVLGANGTIADYEILTSLDGEEWQLVAEGTFAPVGALDLVDLEVTTARYVKLRALSSSNGEQYAGAAEINLYAPPEGQLPANIVPQEQISVADVSSEENSAATERTPADNVLDGDPTTIWHTAWGQGTAPHHITLDLGDSYEVEAVHYLARQDGSPNGILEDYAVYVSDSLDDRGEAVATGTLPQTTDPQVIEVPPTEGRYVTLEFRSSYADTPNDFGSAAEINIQGDLVETEEPTEEPTTEEPTTEEPTTEEPTTEEPTTEEPTTEEPTTEEPTTEEPTTEEPTTEEPTTEQPAGPTAQLSADFVAAGGAVTVSGSGFQPGETVTVSVGDVVLGEAVADEHGVLSLTFTVPADTEPGEYVLLVSGEESGQVLELVLTVTEEDATAGPGGQDGLPSTGAPGGQDGLPSTGAPGGQDGLPSTGAPAGGLVAAFGLLLLAGTAAVLTARRRQLQ